MARRGEQEETGDNRFMAFLAWKKMNNKQARESLPDDQVWWAENIMPVAPNQWQSINGPATPLATNVGVTVIREWGVSFSGNDYIFFIGQSGLNFGLYAFNLATAVTTTIKSSGFGAAVGSNDVVPWAGSRIVGTDTNVGYFTWDGVNPIVTQGGISPNINITNGGTGYSNSFAVTFTGGSGSGATATATAVGGVIVSIVLNSPGSNYKATDVITVVLTAGGGSSGAASARVWPFISGTTLDVFAGRVWIGSARVLTFTGTAGYDDTNPANAAGSTTIEDADLSHRITSINNLNNYLYIFGDSSVRQIGSITVSSGITLFTPLTLSSDIGTTYPQTVKSYNRLVNFANANGAYGIFGATVKKISDDIDGAFQVVNLGAELQAGIIDIHPTIQDGGSFHCYALLMQIFDTFLLNFTRTILAIYYDDKWFFARQGDNLNAIASIFYPTTEHFEIFGSSGTDITPLVESVNATVSIIFKTALSFNKDPLKGKRLVRSGVMVTCQTPQLFYLTTETEQGQQTNRLLAAAVINWVNNLGQTFNFVNNSNGVIQFTVGGYRVPYSEADGEGILIGGSITGVVEGMAINGMAFEYVDGSIWAVGEQLALTTQQQFPQPPAGAHGTVPGFGTLVQPGSGFTTNPLPILPVGRPQGLIKAF